MQPQSSRTCYFPALYCKEGGLRACRSRGVICGAMHMYPLPSRERIKVRVKVHADFTQAITATPSLNF